MMNRMFGLVAVAAAAVAFAGFFCAAAGAAASASAAPARMTALECLMCVPFEEVDYLSNEKMRFQSFFMLITIQPSFVASSYRLCGNVPTFVSGNPWAGP